MSGANGVPGWVEDAACAEVDPSLWFPELGDNTKEAKAICRRCAVQPECLQYALDTHQAHGVWGGLSERERAAANRATRAGRAA